MSGPHLTAACTQLLSRPHNQCDPHKRSPAYLCNVQSLHQDTVHSYHIITGCCTNITMLHVPHLADFTLIPVIGAHTFLTMWEPQPLENVTKQGACLAGHDRCSRILLLRGGGCVWGVQRLGRLGTDRPYADGKTFEHSFSRGRRRIPRH